MSIIEENWDYHINLQEISNIGLQDYELYVKELNNNILKLLEDSFSQSISYEVSTAQSYEDKLNELTDKNRQMRQDIEKILKDLSRKHTQYESFKQNQKLLSQEIKVTHEAFLMAKKYFKNFLKMYFCIESRTEDQQVVFIQFFTEARKDSQNYSVRLKRNPKSKQYTLLSMTPKLKMLKEFQKKLLDTNDVPGALFCIREEFIALKRSKNNSNTYI